MAATEPLHPSPYPASPYLVALPVPWNAGRHAARVLLATDGNERSDGAVRVAVDRALATGALLEVLTVVQTEPVLSPESGFFDERATLIRRTALRQVVEEQLARVLGEHDPISISVLEGSPAYTISRIAVERHPAMVVVGLGRHHMSNRLFSEETALQLARISRVPILAVPASVRETPRYAVVAVDFSDLSTRAAQSAVEAVADTGRVDLVHVLPFAADGGAKEAHLTYQAWAAIRLTALRAELVVPAGVDVCEVTLHGDPAATLLEYATRVGATLVATGTHGRGFISRAMLGSVTTKLLRGASCALLTVPRDPLPALARQPDDRKDTRAGDTPLSWSALLNDFTKRNAGRRTILEIDDLEIGAQAQEYNYPLLGVSYSDRDGRLDLMLGDPTANGRHLARMMRSIVAVDVLSDAQGRDTALRIQSGASQLLLTFAP